MFRRLRSQPSDGGMALPMVIILIVGLSLWMASVAIMTRSTGATIAQNITQMQDRQRLVSVGLTGMIKALTPTDSNADLLGVGEELDPTKQQSCAKDPSTGKNYFTFDDPELSAGNQRIWVSCSESSESGAQQALASFLLVGTGHEYTKAGPAATAVRCADDLNACVTGQDGGLKIVASGGVNRAVITGGLINASGAWEGVNSTTLQMARDALATTAPEILVPLTLAAGTTADKQCPAAIGTVWGAGAGCACPTFFATSAQDGECPTGPPAAQTFTQLDQANSRSVTATYMRSMLKRVAREQESSTDIFNPVAAQIPVGCATAVQGANGLWSITIDAKNGSYIGPTELKALNDLTADGSGTCAVGDGSSNKTPVLIMNGVFRFGPRSGDIAGAVGDGNVKSKTKDPVTNNVWQIKGAKATVIGGPPDSTYTGCASDFYDNAANRNLLKGVSLQFAGSTYIDIPSGILSLCPFFRKSTHVITAPTSQLAAQVPTLGFYWAGARDANSPFIQSAFGSTYTFSAYGLVFAPAAPAQLDLNSSSGATLNGGAVFKGLTLRTNASASKSGTVSPPKSTNGDRTVQLRIWDSKFGRDLGIVRVVIRDQFGQRPGSAYSYTLWRTAW